MKTAESSGLKKPSLRLLGLRRGYLKKEDIAKTFAALARIGLGSMLRRID